MSQKTLGFIALALSILYGVGFTVIDGDARSGYAAVGGAIVAIAWIATGVFGKPDADEDAG
jgi:hypothetical protein